MTFPVFKGFFAILGYMAVHAATIVRIMWLPAMILLGANLFYMSSTTDLQIALLDAGGDSADPSATMEDVGQIFLYTGMMYLGFAIFYPMMFAGLLRHLVRGEAPALPFYLRFGGDELRILGAFLLIMLLSFVVLIVGFLAALAVVFAVNAISETLGAIVVALMPCLVIVGAAWFALRLSVTFPAAIDQRNLGIAQSWRVTKGNAWGLFFFWLLFWVLAFVVTLLFSLVFVAGMAPLFLEMFAAIGANDSDALNDFPRRMLELQSSMLDLANPGFWLYLIGSYIFTIFYMALSAGAGGVAYRYLVGAQRDGG